ncbi:MAG: radical SAM protein, partial [Myxococcales bacterium]|nr:radical SAM protein [Myxococcales bacterium]
PGELNDARRAGDPAHTRAQTEASLAALARLREAGVETGLIVTLHRGNAGRERLPALLAWLRALGADGPPLPVRLHLLQVDDEAVRETLGLTVDEMRAALEALAALEQESTGLRFDLFTELRAMLLGDDEAASCVWRGCDPYSTAAVHAIDGDGTLSNCSRGNHDGVDYRKAESPSYLRALTLARTPQDRGGCRGCRFFLACKGHCPGTAIAGDWRNRSEHCEVYLPLFAQAEARLREQGHTPLSLDPERAQLEQ